MLLVRYQSVAYTNSLQSPIAEKIEFQNGPLIWSNVSKNWHLAISVRRLRYSKMIPLSEVQLGQDVIDYANDDLAVKNGCIGTLESPDPIGVLLFSEDDDEISKSDKVSIEKPDGPDPVFPFHHCDFIEMKAAYLPKERLDFLAACEQRGLARGKLVEYMRLFEAAFGLSGDSLIKKLREFLCSDNCMYSAKEVRSWIRLRGKLNHGDRKKNWSHERSSWVVMPRVRQAAYDVVFNKKSWASKSTVRENKAPIRTQVKSDSGLVLTKGFPASVLHFHLDSFRLSFVNRNWAAEIGLAESQRPDHPVLDVMKKTYGISELIPFEIKTR